LYEGDWVSDAKSGTGKLFDQSGALRYEGGFLRNAFHGYGVLRDEATTYEGFFEGNAFNGQGILH
jgi:hypothetical protein